MTGAGKARRFALRLICVRVDQVVGSVDSVPAVLRLSGDVQSTDVLER